MLDAGGVWRVAAATTASTTIHDDDEDDVDDDYDCDDEGDHDDNDDNNDNDDGDDCALLQMCTSRPPSVLAARLSRAVAAPGPTQECSMCRSGTQLGAVADHAPPACH